MVLFSFLYWSFFAISLPFWFVPQALLFVLAWPFDRRRVLVHLYACAWGMSYVWFSPIWKVRVSGRERLPWRGPAVIVANHLSILDILVLYGLFRPFKWVSKASIFRIPFVGWNMRLNDYVALRRGDRESIKEMMGRCRAHLAAGSPILLFPEGTRSPDGVLQDFRAGAFKLAVEAGCPVIPVAVSGTYAGLPKHGFMLRNRMHAQVRVLEPLHPADHGNDVQRLLQAAHAAIAAVLPVEAQPRDR
jgi:1-acyl-sn-glycerol-3-phosphate acyltransferase